MKRLTLHRLDSLLHRFQHYINKKYTEIAIKQAKTVQHKCKGKEDDIFRLCYGKYGKNELFLEIVNGIHRFIAYVR
jgi:hypothetical protein